MTPPSDRSEGSFPYKPARWPAPSVAEKETKTTSAFTEPSTGETERANLNHA